MRRRAARLLWAMVLALVTTTATFPIAASPSAASPSRAQDAPPAAAPPAAAPPAAAPPAAARPAPVDTVVAQDDMRTLVLFWPRVCPTGQNVGTPGPDGLRLSVTGLCFDASRSASIEALQPDVTVGDGEARVEFRVEQGWDNALVSISLYDLSPDAPSLVGQVAPSVGLVLLQAGTPEGMRPLATGRVDRGILRPDAWTSLAVQRVGDRAWVILNDEPVLVADGVPMGTGTPLPYVNSIARDGTEVVVTLRDFTAATVVGGAPDRGVARAPRPVVDPRYERILGFIRSELVGDPGADAPAAERRAIGRAILGMVETTSVNLTVAPLPEPTVARYRPFRRDVVVDERLMTYTPHVATVLLLHEVVHAHQERTGQPRTCLEQEIDAARWEARLWRAWFGPDGKQPPGDEIEAEFTAAVMLEKEGRLEAAVTEIYRERCAGR